MGREPYKMGNKRILTNGRKDRFFPIQADNWRNRKETDKLSQGPEYEGFSLCIKLADPTTYPKTTREEL